MLCKSCHYPLKQLTEPRCPECGCRFDPDDPNTFDVLRPRRMPFRLRLTFIISGLAYLAMFVLVLLDIANNNARGQVLNNVPNVTIALVPESIASMVLRAAGLAFFNCVPVFIMVYLGCAVVTWAIPYLVPRGLKSRRP